MSRSAAVFMGRADTVSRCAEWLSGDWPPDVRCPRMNAGSHPADRPYASGQPRAPPPGPKALGRRHPAQRPAIKTTMIVMTMLAEAKPKRQQASCQHESAPIPAYAGSRTRREHDKEQTMLALQAAAHGAHSIEALLAAISVLIALFWKAALKIFLLLMVIAILITIMFGAAAVLLTLAHVVR